MKRFHFPSCFVLASLFWLVPLLMFADTRLLTGPTHGSTSAPTEAVLKRAREVSGGDAWSEIGALGFEASENSSGMQGHAQGIDDLKTGRLRRQSDFQVVQFVEVWSDAHHWRQDMSGGVHELDSEFAQMADTTDKWLARRAYLMPGAAHATLGAVQPRTQEGSSYNVLTATPINGQPVELWFDQASGLLSRTVRVMPTTVETVIYTNYKDVGGVRLPHRIVTDDGTDDIDTLEISQYSLNPAITDVAFHLPQMPHDTSVTGGKATIPIEVDGYVTLEARLDGQGPFGFLFDTGGHAILTPEAVTALGLHPAGAGSAGGAGAGRLPVQYTRVDRVEIGGVTLKDQNFLVIPLQYNTVERGHRPPLAGILGLELLERLAVRLNYRDLTMTFWPRGDFHHENKGVSVPITFTDDIPLIRARLNGVQGDFALDTGNGGSVVVQHVWAEQHHLADELKAGVEMVSFGSGGESRNWASRILDFELAERSFHKIMGRYAEDKQGSFSSRTEAGNVGTDILANFTLDFDYAHHRLWLDFVPGFTPVPFPRSGMSFYKKDPESVKVVSVLQGGPAAKAGVHEGDILVRIRGKDAKALSRAELVRIFAQPAETEVPLVYSHQGKLTSGTLVLKELLP